MAVVIGLGWLVANCSEPVIPVFQPPFQAKEGLSDTASPQIWKNEAGKEPGNHVKKNVEAQKLIFQSFWHGPKLSDMLQACLATFSRMDYCFDLYVYAQVDVPDGVTLRDAEEILPLSEIFYFTDSTTGTSDIAPFADLFRFKLLMERGGWWVDVDTICRSANIPNVQRAWSRECPELHGDLTANGQIAFPAGDPVVVDAYDRALRLSRSGIPARQALGSQIITKVVADHGLPHDMNGSKDTFYPINWIEMYKLLLPEHRDEIKIRTRASYFLPVYHSLLVELGIQNDTLPPVGSYLFEDCVKPYTGNNTSRCCSRQDIVGRMRDFMQERPWARQQLDTIVGTEAGRLFD